VTVQAICPISCGRAVVDFLLAAETLILKGASRATVTVQELPRNAARVMVVIRRVIVTSKLRAHRCNPPLTAMFWQIMAANSQK
jgi:hypothetical protein